jgi:DNA helicase-2/ATP-dependent DNA helicase PcrA
MDSAFDDMPEPERLVAPRPSLTDGMNEAQAEAIMFRDGACLVVAGAGSGKTTVMTKRVAALVESGVSPDEILLLTFTNKAARNMVERARLYTPHADRVAAGTFHSVAFRLLRENAHLFNLPGKPSLIDANDTESVFKAIAKRLGGKDANLPAPSVIASAHGFAVNTMRDLDDVVFDKYEQYSSDLDYMRKVVEEYRLYKRERALFDYDDLLAVWNRMLDHPSVTEEMRRRFRYVMVDEHQDSNALQCSIIVKLAGEHPNVMVVGDPAQAIYAFRGAAPRTMFSFRETWPSARVIQLNVNYRSTEEVLAVGNAVDASMSERFDRQLLPAPGARGSMPRMVAVPSPDQEAVFVAEKVLEAKSLGTPLHEQAVLVRSLHAARMIEFEFDRRKIPYRVFGGLRVTEARHIKDFFSLVRCAINPLDEPAWTRALLVARKVGPAMAEKIVRAMSGKGDPTAAALTVSKNNPDVGTLMQAWERLASGQDRPVAALERALDLVDGLFLAAFPDDWKKSRKPDITALIAMAAQFDDLDAYMSTMTLDGSAEKTSWRAEADDGERPITISTTHSAKGLEFDTVYIPNFVKGHMPSGFARDREGLEEERRVLYVAVTRPRKDLVVTVPTFDFQGNRNERSVFEEELSDHFERSRWGAGHVTRGFGFSSGGRGEIDLSDM